MQPTRRSVSWIGCTIPSYGTYTSPRKWASSTTTLLRRYSAEILACSDSSTKEFWDCVILLLSMRYPGRTTTGITNNLTIRCVSVFTITDSSKDLFLVRLRCTTDCHNIWSTRHVSSCSKKNSHALPTIDAVMHTRGGVNPFMIGWHHGGIR